MRWHVAVTESQAETKSCGKIRELGFEAFAPMERHKRFKRGKRVLYERPLFPAYLFVRFEAEDPSWTKIRNVDCVRDILCNQNRPLAVPLGLTEKLQRMQSLGLFDHTKPPFHYPPGTMVVLDNDGPFAEFIGKVMRVRTADRVDLLIKYLHRELTINVSLSRLAHI